MTEIDHPTIICPRCDGSGLMSDNDAVPCQPDGTIVGDRRFTEAPDSVRSIETCWSCNGLTVRKRHGAYASAATAQRGIANRTAERCTYCEATGHMLRLRVLRKCWDCSGQGRMPIYVPGGVLPEPFSHCDRMATVVAEAFAGIVNLHVTTKPTLSWGEANMGLGSVYTVVDYGDRWKACRERLLAQDQSAIDIAAIFEPLKAEIREHLAKDRIQWVKILDRESRVMASDLVIFLTPNGYTVKAANVAQAKPLLPPTYTDEVLDAPM